MSDWHDISLGEIVALGKGKIQTGPFGSQLHASDYRETGIPCVMPVNIVDNLISSTGIMRISEKDAERLSRYILVEGDIVYSRRGDVTRRALVGKDESGWFCGTGCLMIRPGNMIHPKFLNYHLAEPDTKEWIIRHAVGATMPNLNTEILAAVPLSIPSFDSQVAIANILSSLDDKIVLNRKLNKTLEQMARALFQSWFVDFDPVKAKLAAKRHGRDPERACMAAISGKLRIPAGKPRAERLDDQLPTADELDAAIAALDTLTEAQRRQLAETAGHFPADFHDSEMGTIPDGWRTVPFSKHAEIKMGQSPKGETYNTEGIGIPLVNGPVEFGYYFTDSNKWTTSPTKICEPNDLIVCVRGSTTGRYVKSNGQYCIGRGVCAIHGKESQSFVDFIFKDNCARLLAMTTGSTFPNWSGAVLSNFSTAALLRSLSRS